MMQDPGWVLFPSDLDYFISYENSDYEMRVSEALKGSRKERSCPTAAQYLYTQRQSGRLPPEAVGGLYRRVFLRRLHPHISPNTLLQEKSWFGAPIAALRRAIHATGSFRVSAFDNDDLEKLRSLQKLYARPDPEVQPYGSFTVTEPIGATAEDENNSPPPKRRRLSNNNPDDPDKKIPNQATEYYHTKAVFNWILGPDMTTNEIVSRYASVF